MRHQRRRSRLSRPSGHREAMLQNLAAAVLEHGKVQTTLPKAKEVRSLVERIITLGKREENRLHARRQALSYVPRREIVARVFDDLAVRFADRNGGYTRIYHLGYRRGDGAPMALIEILPAETKAEHVPESATAKPSGWRGVVDRFRGRRTESRHESTKDRPGPEQGVTGAEPRAEEASGAAGGSGAPEEQESGPQAPPASSEGEKGEE
ncbi:MAG: 50S ribosomal protein L17 [Candidatus Schekmanbacteria bacterium]|nr:50S ribosomal protein L17 [Candidatus Schekmanbacteria bacterium]